jgi:hypothetical protein
LRGRKTAAYHLLRFRIRLAGDSPHAESVLPITFRAAAIGGVALLLAAGCSKKADNTMNSKSAINRYYDTHLVCLFPQPVKFPVQVPASDTSKTAPYDALVDQGLLARTSAEKKVVIVSKRENNYDLSDQGRQAWTPDPSQPGYGSSCYGHRTVSTIDNATPASSDPGATTQVTYRYTIVEVPSWATAAETKTAFPEVQANLSGPQSGSASLTNTNNGWQVSSVQDASGSRSPATSDGRVVQ